MFTCLICGKTFNSLNPVGRHLKRLHGMSSQEYYDKYLKKENEGKCVICGNPTKFWTINSGYSKHCSFKCAAVDPNTKKNRENTVFSNTGYKHVSQIPENRKKVSDAWKNKSREELDAIEEKRLKNGKIPLSELQDVAKQAMLEKHGVDNIFKDAEYMKKKYQEKLGVDNPFQLEYVKKKASETLYKKHGVKCANQLPKRKQRCIEANLQKATENFKNKLDSNYTWIRFLGDYKHEVKCNTCGETIICSYPQICWYKERLCKKCHKHNEHQSRFEDEIIDFITQKYEYNLEHGNRKVLFDSFRNSSRS